MTDSTKSHTSSSDAAMVAEVSKVARQGQFLAVASRAEAEERLRAHLKLEPLGQETISIGAARGRILAEDLAATVDVPCFDRSNVDGFAVRASDLEQAAADAPVRLRLNAELLTPGVIPAVTVEAGTATVIATGGVVPRGADAVVMVEHTEVVEAGGESFVEVVQALVPGALISVAGSDIAAGETVLRRGLEFGSREIAMLAAIGVAEVPVFRRPKVAILSTGDELIAPGQPIQPGKVYDSNGPMLAAAVEELGCETLSLGIIVDDQSLIEAAVDKAVRDADVVLLSGGTSKGAGDFCYHAVARFSDPGIVVHGVSIKPGKPLCLAVTAGKPVVILPGFPTSATFTFHEFVAPVLRAFSGLPPLRRETVKAELAVRTASDPGRTDYVLVSLAEKPDGGLAAYPMGKSSGAVTSFSLADGFFAIPDDSYVAPAGAAVEVALVGSGKSVADLTIIGSHCVGLDYLVGRLAREGLTAKVLSVGSNGGLTAAKRGECDIAGVHLMDPATGVYNEPYLTAGLRLCKGYGRLQGVVFRKGDPRFEGKTPETAVAGILTDPNCLMVNRNVGSGTRVLIDRLLGTAKPAGHSHQTRSHNAVAVAVAQKRADWGVAIETMASFYGLGFLPLQEELYDFVIPAARFERPAVRRFRELLIDPTVIEDLKRLGFRIGSAAAEPSQPR